MIENENTWVEVWNCTWPHEAQFLRSVLEAADIQVFLPDEYTLGVDPSLVPALHDVRMHSVDLQRAREVIDSARQEPPTSETEDAV
jgi:hypothetical protein